MCILYISIDDINVVCECIVLVGSMCVWFFVFYKVGCDIVEIVIMLDVMMFYVVNFMSGEE